MNPTLRKLRKLRKLGKALRRLDATQVQSSISSFLTRKGIQRCDVCRDMAGFHLAEYAHDIDGRTVQLWSCRSCAVLTTIFDPAYSVSPADDHQLQAESSSEFYGGKLAVSREALLSEIEAHTGILEPLDAHLEDRGAKSFGEIGYGRGMLLLSAARRFRRVVGVEIQEGPIRRLVDMLGGPMPSNIELRSGASEVAEPVDVWAAWHTVEHLRSPLSVLRPYVDRLAPGGLFYAQVPLYRPAYLCLTHYWFFNDRSARVMLKRLGLSPIEVAFDCQNSFLTMLARKPR